MTDKPFNPLSPLGQNHKNAQSHSRQIEALLHAAENAVSAKQLRAWLGLSTAELDRALMVLQERLTPSALKLAQTAGGYRLQIDDAYAALIGRAFPERREQLSPALLEILSVIAYKQPVTRGDIEQARGVSVSSAILRQLFDKGWIAEKGHKDALGKPAFLVTTDAFLDAFGLMRLEELPPLPPLEPLEALPQSAHPTE